MTRRYTPLDTDLADLLIGLAEAGYNPRGFATLGWDELRMPMSPDQHFVQLSRAVGARSFCQEYQCRDEDWVGRAICDIQAGKFGRP
ncbi:MAG TPA: hypothetical protein VGN52_11030 [Burkholderiales bacterium]|jgi:hypothetical protein